MNAALWSEEHQPIRWVGRHPVYLAHYIAMVFGLSMVVTAVMSGLGLQTALAALVYQSPEVLHGQVWRIFTYGFVNGPSIWFVLELVMIVWFGREVEKFFGRTIFFLLYCALYLVPPVLHTAVGFWRPSALSGESSAFGLFVAFATLYPNAAMLFNFVAKWVAGVLLGVYTLQYLAVHDWLGMASLWAVAGCAYLFILHQQGRLSLPSISRGPRLQPARAVSVRPASTALAEADALLDKVARSGLSSLTPKELAKLDAVRAELKKRSRG
jgi:membrane associated rhomboid family serine protease